MLFYTSKDCNNSNQEIDLQKITSGIKCLQVWGGKNRGNKRIWRGKGNL